MSVDSVQVESKKAKRSTKYVVKGRLTSINDLDKRSNVYREVIDLINALQADQGGADALSAIQLQLIESSALTSAMRRHLGALWLSGAEVDVTVYCTLANSERRIAETLGLRRVPRTVPDLRDYLDAKTAEVEAE